MRYKHGEKWSRYQMKVYLSEHLWGRYHCDIVNQFQRNDLKSNKHYKWPLTTHFLKCVRLGKTEMDCRYYEVWIWAHNTHTNHYEISFFIFQNNDVGRCEWWTFIVVWPWNNPFNLSRKISTFFFCYINPLMNCLYDSNSILSLLLQNRNIWKGHLWRLAYVIRFF